MYIKNSLNLSKIFPEQHAHDLRGPKHLNDLMRVRAVSFSKSGYEVMQGMQKHTLYDLQAITVP